jgi:hypothetical protein
MRQSQESISMNTSETTNFGALELEELSRLFRERPTTLRKEVPAKCRASAVQDQPDQPELFNSFEPQRLAHPRDSTSLDPRPRRFYRTFWRGITKRALAQHTRCGTK